MFAAFKGKCTHCGHDHDEDTATPAPAPVTVSDEMVTKAWAVYYGKRNGRSGCSQYDAMRAALEAYEAARGAGDGWVACSERMPEDDDYVWIYPQEQQAKREALGRGKFQWVPNVDPINGPDWSADAWSDKEVTHWRPLPPPPTDKAREE